MAPTKIAPENGGADRPDTRRFAMVAGAFQLVLFVLFVVCVDYDADLHGEYTPRAGNGDQVGVTKLYGAFQDVHVMVFIGFGFLMTFLAKYAFSAVGLNFFLAALSVQWGILLVGFWHNVDVHHGHEDQWSTVKLNIEMLVKGDFAAAAVLITFGAVLGKTSPVQMVGVVFFELIFYTMNEYLGAAYLDAVDIGGSMFIHAFGAFFGLALSYVLGRDQRRRSKTKKRRWSRWVRPSESDAPPLPNTKTSDTFAMIGTLFLWMYWPSFNGALAPTGTQHRVFANTVIALCGSCVGTFIFSQLKRRKFSMVDVQNATLAGGVAIGGSADLSVQPWGALLIGLVASAVSVFGYTVLQEWLSTHLKLSDTCGVNNLHGMPGILGGLAGTVAAALAKDDVYGQNVEALYPARAHRTAGEQAGYQFLALVFTVLIALASGAFTGLIIRTDFFEGPGPGEFNNDSLWWEEEADVEAPAAGEEIAMDQGYGKKAEASDGGVAVASLGPPIQSSRI